MKLNLGAGATEIPGYFGLDAKSGDRIFPLDHADASAEEIRASHVLEHFPHGQIRDVILDWVRVLQPGGVLKIAVPDFGFVAERYLAGVPLNVEGYVMGGQVDDLDYHKALFDEGMLRNLLIDAGLVGVRRWKSEIEDCAALPVSLNLAGTKPPKAWPKVACVLSMPRLGFNDFWACIYQELGALQVPLRKVTGAYWERDLTLGIEQAMAELDPEWILTADYDTIFTRHQVLALLDVAMRYPHADAIAPLQTARHHEQPMFTARLPGGELLKSIERETIERGEVIRAETAHFGLTLLKASKLEQLPRPWFARQFDEKGGLGDGSRDPDVSFWHAWKAAGNTLYVALRVPVGHCELMVRWPNQNLEASFQRPSEFWSGGPPDDVWR